jgi:hypothetical protein
MYISLSDLAIKYSLWVYYDSLFFLIVYQSYMKLTGVNRDPQILRYTGGYKA